MADIASGAVHVLSETAYNALDNFTESGEYVGAQMSEAEAELLMLKDRGELFTPDVYREIANHWEKQSVIKALCLHIAHDCNLRCRYCFAHGGEYMGKRELMSAKVGKAAIDFVIKESKNRRNIEIDYFGGEPLMNFDTVREITNYAKEQGREHDKEFRFTITTNGMLLDDKKIEYINENMSNVVLSLDGRKEVHDSVRVRLDGSGSYDAVVPKFQKLVKGRGEKSYYVRGTFTRDNLDFLNDVKHIHSLGFEQISVEPVVAKANESYALCESDLPEIFKQYEQLALDLVKTRKEGGFYNFFHFMIDFEQGPCAYKRLAGCGSGHEYAAVTPNGDIYPCHQFVSDKSFKMGDVFRGITNSAVREKFLRSNIYTKKGCSECWARFYCSGGCAANAYQMNGDIEKPYSIACEMEKKRVECAIAAAALLAQT